MILAHCALDLSLCNAKQEINLTLPNSKNEQEIITENNFIFTAKIEKTFTDRRQISLLLSSKFK